MKELEKELDFTLWNPFWFIVRLDWKGFSKFTKKYFEKPYDKNLDDIFQEVTKKLVEEYGPNLSYTQSDEITLFFKTEGQQEMYFSWRIQKIVSLLSAKTTAHFINELYKRNLSECAITWIPHFDARVFIVKNVEEVYKSFEFRYFDCLRNARLNLACFLPKKDRLNKSWKEIVKEVLEKKWFDYYSLPLSYRKWTFFVKAKEKREFTFKEEVWEVLRTVVKKVNVDNYPSTQEEFYNLFLDSEKAL